MLRSYIPHHWQKYAADPSAIMFRYKPMVNIKLAMYLGVSDACFRVSERYPRQYRRQCDRSLGCILKPDVSLKGSGTCLERICHLPESAKLFAHG